MRRLALCAAWQFAVLGAACAQDVVSVRVAAPPCGRFYVDGQPYEKAATFFWPKLSVHTLASAGIFSISNEIQCVVSGSWTSDGGAAQAGTGLIYVSKPAAYTFTSGYLYRLRIVLNNGTGVPSFNCSPSGIYVNNVCYSADTDLWLSGGSTIAAMAVPPSGFALMGWDDPGGFVDGGPAISVSLNGPVNLRPRWRPAGHVTINTEPQGMKVLVDYTQVTSPATFDWAPGTQHALSPVTPQDTMVNGAQWAFSTWSDGGVENRMIAAPDSGRWLDLTAKYVQGVRASFGTVPIGLKLSIDGKTAWPSYNFVWAAGSKHTVSAPLEQVDTNGRAWAFSKWTTGGSAEQTYTVTGEGQPVTNAIYDPLGAIVVQSSIRDVNVLVDGVACMTPCIVNRAPGTDVKIAAPAAIAIDANERLEFDGWADGGLPERVVKTTKEGALLTANYHTSYRLVPTSDPAGGSNFTYDPPSPDGFYAPNTWVTITAQPKPGFRFRTWDGAVSLSPALPVRMIGPVSVKAMLDSFPVITAVTNGAGATPEVNVAPGSIILIGGANLAPSTQNGPASPLAQAIDGVTVSMDGERMLPLVSVAPDGIYAQLWSGIAEGEHTMTVHQPSRTDVSAKFHVQRNAPGLFTQTGSGKPYALAMHDDGTPVTVEKPAMHGETVTLLGTGFGPCKPSPPDGFALPNQAKNVQYALQDLATIRSGDKVELAPASVQAAKGYVGTIAVRLTITNEFPAGADAEIRAAVKDPNGKTYHESNKVLLPVK